MTDLEWSSNTWRKSTASGTSNCVEVAFSGESVLMRNSRSQQGPIVSFSYLEWEAFLTGVRNGEFDTVQPVTWQTSARTRTANRQPETEMDDAQSSNESVCRIEKCADGTDALNSPQGDARQE